MCSVLWKHAIPGSSVSQPWLGAQQALNGYDRDKPRALGILLNPSQCPFTQLKKVDNKTHLIGAWYGLHELNVNKALSPGLRTQ